LSSLCLIAILLFACSSDEPEADNATTSSTASTSTTEPSSPAGPIAFQRGGDEADIYAVDLDGTNEQRLFEGPAQLGRWSPDGTELAIFCCDNGMVAHLLNVSTRELREFPAPDPTLETHCGFAWSPGGDRLSCETFGIDDPALNGIYTIRTSDGGDLTRITSNPGGDDIPGDYSPDGARMVFVRFVDEKPVGFFVTNVDGSGLRQITTQGMVIDDSGFGGRWSPDGTKILIVGRSAEDRHKAIWVVDAASGEPTLLEMSPACGKPSTDPGEYGCYAPSWSPDGTQIVFTRSDGSTESIYTANADGTDVVQITDGNDDQAVWGTTRL
jgi:Tol biopolymer transport system component